MTVICSEPLENGEKKPLFKYWVHTNFLPKNKECEDFISVWNNRTSNEQIPCTVNKSKIISLNKELAEDVTMEFHVKKSNKLDMKFQNVSFSLEGLNARIEGLHNIIEYFDVVIDAKSYKRVNSSLYDDSIVKIALKLSVNNVEKATEYLRSGILDPKKDFIYMRSRVSLFYLTYSFSIS